MKRILILAVLFMLVFSFSAMALDPADFTNSLASFADDAAPSVPMLADVGLRWSDAYIGGFPHFGVGVSAGFVVIPVDNIEQLYTTLGLTSVPQELIDLGGLPILADAVEARIGGFILPFDIGIKAGYIPDAAKDLLNKDASVDYKMFGLDIRYRLVKEGLLMPEISVGAGYTRLDGMVSTSVGSNTTIDDGNGTYTVDLTAPDVYFGWRSNVLDAHVQVSKNILFILRPYAGLGVSYGISEAGGGYSADVVENAPGSISYYENNYGISFSADGAEYYKKANGAAFRAFAGTSVNLLMIKLDLSGTYNPVSQALGAQLNVRAQF